MDYPAEDDRQLDGDEEGTQPENEPYDENNEGSAADASRE